MLLSYTISCGHDTAKALEITGKFADATLNIDGNGATVFLDATTEEQAEAIESYIGEDKIRQARSQGDGYSFLTCVTL
jgi:hypothetical protein